MTPRDLQLGSSKITPRHRERLACIYVRQSTPKQVAQHQESQRYQYQLAARAQALGWPADRTQIIATDLGVSGAQSDHRDGFQELVSAVSLGHVGILFGYEVSRLARNNRDWYHLLDLAAVFGTLIADVEGIYDPRLYNDRLLLGLKGTMSEAELHWLRLRLDAGRLSQVQRGAYRQALPTGFIRLPDGRVVKDPDQQVCHVIALVFEQFTALGSCRQVLHYLHREQILLPRRHSVGPFAGQLFWKSATDAAVRAILHNPAYAGAFTYGRRQSDPARRHPHRPNTGRLRQPMEQWVHVQQDVYPAYISWEQFLANRARLQDNSTVFVHRRQTRPGPVREGAALLQGLVVCGACGARMRPCYQATHRDHCEHLARRVAGRMCASLHGPAVDQVVVDAFFAALQPAHLNALDAVLQTQTAEQEGLQRQWQEQCQRAHYEVRLAQRQYDAVDPEYRLVAAELERRWEEKLRALRSVEEAYARFQQQPPTPTLTLEQRAQFQRLSDTLPTLWHSGQVSRPQQKELLRCLITRVILKRVAPELVEVRIVWISGHVSLLQARTPIQRSRDVTTRNQLIARVEQLWHQGIDSDAEMAAQLSAEGFYSARCAGVSPSAVQKIRLAHGWCYGVYQSRHTTYGQGYVTVEALATLLGVERTWVLKRLAVAVIPATAVKRLPHSRVWLIKDDPDLMATLQQQIAAHRHP
jgi:DNA invertase Pin-like site-specific DNA recombinase